MEIPSGRAEGELSQTAGATAEDSWRHGVEGCEDPAVHFIPFGNVSVYFGCHFHFQLQEFGAAEYLRYEAEIFQFCLFG